MTPAIEAEAKILQALENEITGMQTKQQTLTSQLNENSMVKQVRTYQKAIHMSIAHVDVLVPSKYSFHLFAVLKLTFQNSFSTLMLNLQEMDLLNEDSKVYKLVGPVLVLQDFVMAKDNVEKRLEYIQKDMKRVDEAISKKSKEAGDIQQKIVKMQKDEVERLKSLQAN